MRKILHFLLKFLVLMILPFIFLIRGAIFLHEEYQMAPSLAILGGAIATIILLILYFSYFYGTLTGKIGSLSSFKWRATLALFVVVAYCGNGLLSLSEVHAKTDTVKKEFTSLHPILRLSISTILLIDKDFMLTDASRLPEDYKKMGLKSKKHSLHYRQKNGYVHAFDVRTKGKSNLRNFLLTWYFKLMGMNTLRHTGTGDHLHISLKSFDRPHAI
ncbi:MAG: hypothetical protein AB8G15_21345 [Saprospiraceae bacterium]